MSQTWHHGLVARWWAEFNTGGPEIEAYRRYVEQGPTLDVACGTGKSFMPMLDRGDEVVIVDDNSHDGTLAVYDYMRVVVIFAPPARAAPLEQRIADGLGQLGDVDPKDIRRGRAVGVIARPPRGREVRRGEHFGRKTVRNLKLAPDVGKAAIERVGRIGDRLHRWRGRQVHRRWRGSRLHR